MYEDKGGGGVIERHTQSATVTPISSHVEHVGRSESKAKFTVPFGALKTCATHSVPPRGP